jgi:hypothetical protein
MSTLWRKPVIFIPALVALGCVVYGALWFTTASLLQSQAQRWIAQQRQAGLSVSHGEVRLGGFPARVVVTYPAWSMSRPERWSWRTDHISLWSEPWRPNRFTVDLVGTHEVNGAWTPVGVLNVQRAELRPTFALDGRVGEVALSIEKLDLGAKDAQPLIQLASGALSVARMPGQDTPVSRLSLSVDELSAAGLDDLSPRLKTARLTADLMGEVAPGPLPSALSVWREGGGTVEVREVYLDWPPLTVSGSGTLALDDQLQPIGAMTAKFTGFFETVDALSARGLVRTSDASMARIVLGILARTPQGGGPAEINLAVTAQNRKLYTGPLPLMTLPDVAWPDDVLLP